VAAHDHVDLGDLLREGEILLVAEVGQDDDEVGLLLDLGQQSPDGLRGGAELTALGGAAGRDLRRDGGDDADHADPDAVYLEEGPFRVAQRLSVGPGCVRAEHGEGRDLAVLLDHRPAVVELVIADGHGVVAHRVHHREGRPALEEARDRGPGHAVSRVEKQHVGPDRPLALHVAGDPGHPAGSVVSRHEVGVNVVRVQEEDRRRTLPLGAARTRGDQQGPDEDQGQARDAA
jgi:hypothetical protein